jgi:hypothetical protein
MGLLLYLPFLAARKLDFSFPSFSNLQQSQVLCVVCAPPCFLHSLQCFSKRTFLETQTVELVPGCFFPFSPLLEDLSDFSKVSDLPCSWCRCVQSLLTKSEASACPLASCPSCSCYTGTATGVDTYAVHEPLAQPPCLHERNVLGLGAGICIGAVVEAQHLCDVGVELLYTPYKLAYVDVLGLSKYI